MSEDIRQEVIEALAMYSDSPIPNDDDVRAIEDLGLDSQDGIAMACELSERLGFDIPDDVNPLVDDEENRGRTIREIVNYLSILIEEQRTKGNDN